MGLPATVPGAASQGRECTRTRVASASARDHPTRPVARSLASKPNVVAAPSTTCNLNSLREFARSEETLRSSGETRGKCGNSAPLRPVTRSNRTNTLAPIPGNEIAPMPWRLFSAGRSRALLAIRKDSTRPAAAIDTETEPVQIRGIARSTTLEIGFDRYVERTDSCVSASGNLGTKRTAPIPRCDPALVWSA